MANWRKYPNSRRPDMVSVDIIDKYVDEKTGKLHIKRLLIIEGVGYPPWLKKILGTNVGYFIENTTVDLDERRLELNSENITFSHLLRLQEQCVYVPAPNNPDTETLFTQTARVTAFPYGLASAMEYMCSQSFKANAVKGQSIMEETILRVKHEMSVSIDKTKAEIERAELYAKAKIEEAKEKSKHIVDEIVDEKNKLLDKTKRHVDDKISLVEAKLDEIEIPFSIFCDWRIKRRFPYGLLNCD